MFLRSFLRPWRLTMLGSAAFAAAVVAPWVTPQDRPVFRTTSELVVVNAVVLSDDKPALDLEAEDFRITEDGQERPISAFLPASWVPGEVVLAVDVSGSMQMWPAREATLLLLDSLHPETCVLLVPFRKEILGGTWGRAGDQELRRGVAGLDFAGSEAIFDAMIFAVEQLKERAATRGLHSEGVADPEHLPFLERGLNRFGYRKAPPLDGAFFPLGDCDVDSDPGQDMTRPGVRQRIVVVTDGNDTGSRSSVEDAMLAVWGSGIPIFILAAENGSSANARLYATMRGLRRLTELSGGGLFRGVRDHPRHAKVHEALLRLIGGLRAHYVLGYVPSTSADEAPLVEREVRIEVTRPDYEVLAPTHVMLGPAKARNDAIELARRGFRQLEAARTDDAIGTFERASAIDPGLGVAYYGHGIALLQLGRPQEALEYLDQAAGQDPWLPGLDVRRAEVAIATGDFEQAWEYVLSARDGGSDVSDLMSRLQRLAPRELKPAEHRGLPRVSLQAGSDDGLLSRTSVVPVLLAAAGRVVWESSAMTLAGEGEQGEFSLLLDLRDVDEHGPRISVRGWLVLRDEDGDKLGEARLVLRNALSEDEYVPALEAAIHEVEEEIRAR